IDCQRDAKGLGLIHYAAMAGNTAMIDLLLSHDVSLKITSWEGLTPLHAAVTARHSPTEATAAVLAAGPDVNARDLFERTPLYVAAAAGAEPAVLKLLLDAGAKVDRRGDWDYSPLLLAANRGDKENVRLLLSYKADPNQQDKDGRTVLHHAALKGDLELAKIVLAFGAGTRMRDNSRMLARVYATNGGHPEISDYILQIEAERIKAAGSQPSKPIFPEDTPKRPKKETVYIK
ncbi:MAG: ankyrin repeat domain-containing protein, partial [Phycisphaerae bacterium]|nr:ankyrin repeat domain-containing protein [Phycisphaerae bacterium]